MVVIFKMAARRYSVHVLISPFLINVEERSWEKQHQQTLHYVPKRYDRHMPYFRQNSNMTDLFLHGTTNRHRTIVPYTRS